LYEYDINHIKNELEFKLGPKFIMNMEKAVMRAVNKNLDIIDQCKRDLESRLIHPDQQRTLIANFFKNLLETIPKKIYRTIKQHFNARYISYIIWKVSKQLRI